MPPWLFSYAAQAWVACWALWVSPGATPLMLVMFPTVMEFAVTPTSVAPPLPPAGAAVPAVDPPPGDPPLGPVPALPGRDLPDLPDLPARRPGAPVDRRAEPPEAPLP